MTADKVLLVKPDYGYFPIGIAYVIAALEKHDIAYDFLDYYLDPNPDLERMLKSGQYLAVATGGLIGNYTFFGELFRRVKNCAPELPCILGGNITIDLKTDLLFAAIPADILVIGEADITFPLLLERLAAAGRDFSDIEGLAFRAASGPDDFIRTTRRPPLDLADENRILNWDFFDRESYGFQTMPVLTGRGCTGRCTFCSPTNGRFRGRPLEHILEEIETLNAKYDFAHYVFMNEIFFPDEESIYQFCREYKKIKPLKPWHCLMRMDINPDILYAMRDAGCTLMNVGVESGNDRVLKIIKKDITTADTRRFVNAAKRADVVIQASFMMANYGEEAEDIKQTIDLMLELEITGPMALTINYPGTLNYVRAVKRGLILDETRYINSLDLLYSKSYYQVISGHLSGTLSYLNLSGLEDATLFRVVEREMRRYFTQGFRVADARLEINSAEGLTIAKGGCPFCGNNLCMEIDDSVLHPFSLRMECDKCGGRDIYFSPFEFQQYREHFEAIRLAIKKAQRLMIIAGAEDARMLLMYDLFEIDYENLLGFAAHQELEAGFALNHRIMDVQDLLDAEPDLILVVSYIPHDIQPLIDSRLGIEYQIKTVCLTSGNSHWEIKAMKNMIWEDKTLVVCSGPADLVTLLFSYLYKQGATSQMEAIIQNTRLHLLKDTPLHSVHPIPEGLISLKTFDSKLLQTLKANHFETVIFLTNNDSLIDYQKIQRLIAALEPQKVLAFPVGNRRVTEEKLFLYAL